MRTFALALVAGLLVNGVHTHAETKFVPAPVELISNGKLDYKAVKDRFAAAQTACLADPVVTDDATFRSCMNEKLKASGISVAAIKTAASK